MDASTVPLTRGRVVLDVSTYFDRTGKVEVPAILLGPLAVTPCLQDEGGWHVTHVATGWKIDQIWPSFRHRVDAVAAMRMLVALDSDWQPSDWSKSKVTRMRGAVTRICKDIHNRRGET